MSCLCPLNSKLGSTRWCDDSSTNSKQRTFVAVHDRRMLKYWEKIRKRIFPEHQISAKTDASGKVRTAYKLCGMEPPCTREKLFGNWKAQNVT